MPLIVALSVIGLAIVCREARARRRQRQAITRMRERWEHRWPSGSDD